MSVPILGTNIQAVFAMLWLSRVHGDPKRCTLENQAEKTCKNVQLTQKGKIYVTN